MWLRLGDIERLLHCCSLRTILAAASPTRKGACRRISQLGYASREVSVERAAHTKQQAGADLVMKVLLSGLHLLLSARSDLSVCNAAGQTPLWLAAAGGHLGVVRVLLEASKQPLGVADAKGQTPLHAASDAAHVAVVTALLEAGADTASTNRCVFRSVFVVVVGERF
jgi:ankyrin repeat protein